jgi:hypothetical protein
MAFAYKLVRFDRDNERLATAHEIPGDQVEAAKEMRTSSLFALVRTLERNGIQFIDADGGGEGVRLRR